MIATIHAPEIEGHLRRHRSLVLTLFPDLRYLCGTMFTNENPLRICLWSGPRNVSTALMYSFAQRDDTRVFDEPLYGHYLRVSGAEHPGRQQVLESMETDGRRVVDEVILGSSDRPVLFQKHMAHHLTQLDRSFLLYTCNVLLIRDPEQMLPSLQHQLKHPCLGDTGLEIQVSLLKELRALGQDPLVIDSRELLLDPPGVLRRVCRRLGLFFQPAMLDWPSGPRREDGVWAPHWYANVHRSTGFQPYRPKTEPFPDDLAELLEECRPFYRTLNHDAIRA